MLFRSMDSIGMVQGQEIEVYFEVWDNDGVHGPKSKRSETFSYSKPSEAALDSIASQSEKEILDRLSEKSKDAADLKDEIEKMLRELTIIAVRACGKPSASAKICANRTSRSTC